MICQRISHPSWFLETSLDGKFSDRSSACEGLLEQNQDVASFGPIFIPEDQDAKICIRFPARDGRPITWRHDIGSRGPCSNQCCEFKPPTQEPPSPSPPANLVRDLRRLLQHSFSHQRTNLVQRKRLGPQEHLLPVGRWNLRA